MSAPTGAEVSVVRGMPSGIGGMNEVDTGNDCVQT